MESQLIWNPNKELLIGHDFDYFYSKYHSHKCYEFLMVVRGKSLNVINGDVQILERKSLTAIRPNDVHCIKKIETVKERYEFFNIPAPIEYINEQYRHCAPLREIIEDGALPTCIILSNTEMGVLTEKALRLEKIKSSIERNYLYFCLVKELCSCMLRYDEIKNEKMPMWFSKIVVDLDDIPIGELSYELLFEEAKVSKTLLWKMFKKYYNVTPTEYINDKRITSAYNLVVNTKKSLLDIAYEVGFGSYSHFHREFVRRYSVSPKSLRMHD